MRTEKPEVGCKMSREEEFLLLVQTAIQAMMQAAMCRTDIGTSDKALRMFGLTNALSKAVELSALIPPQKPTSTAALEFIDHLFDRHVAAPHEAGSIWMPYLDLDKPDPNRTAWMGLPLLSREGDNELSAVEHLIDGIWQPRNPEWDGLPFDDSASLRLLVYIRNNTRSSMSVFRDVLPEVSEAAIETVLERLTKERWIFHETSGDEPGWSADTQLLIAVSPNAALKAPEAPKPSTAELLRVRDAKRRQDADDRLLLLHEEPDAHRLLLRIKSKGPAAVQVLQPLVPHMARDALVRLLKRLRDAGWLQVVGEKRNAFWEATGKLRDTRLKRPSLRSEP
jgi:hypothetical protein